MTINKLIENLKKYAAPKPRMPVQERNFIQRRVMRELTGQNYNKIKSWMDSTDGGELSFDGLFDGKKRVIVPWAKKSKADGTIGDIIEFFETNGWEVDLSTGTVSRMVEREIPKGPRKGEKISKTEKIRIGKIFQMIMDWEKYIASGTMAQRSRAKEDAMVANIKKFLPKFDPDSNDEMVKAESMAEFWSTKAEYYRNNPDAVNRSDSQYSIIVSRHPIDVLRMSDFEDISSCHSQGGGYFQCAMAEAKGHGPIAYLVNTEDLAKADLDDEEIFEDPSRNISGIRPISRVRLRKFVNKEEAQELAIPELRVYGQRVPGFVEAVRNWAQVQQKDIVDMEAFSFAAFNSDEITRYGGSYGDAVDGSLFNIFFDSADYSGNAEHIDDGEGEDLFDEYEIRCNDILNRAREDLEHTHADYSIEDSGDGEPYVMMNGGVGFDLSDELEDVEMEVEEVAGFIEKAGRDNNIYLPDPKYDAWQEYNKEYSTYIENEDEAPTPDGFENFVSYLEDIDRKYDDIMESIRELLEEEGIISTELSPERGAALHQKLAKMENIRTIIEGSKFTIVTKRPIQLDTNIRKWQRVPKDTLVEFKKKYEEVVKKNIIKRVLEKAHGLVKWADESGGDPIGQLYGLNIAMDGITFKFLEVYEVNNKKDMLNMEEYISTIDANFGMIEKTAREVFKLLTDKYAEELAGQMRLPMAAESKKVTHDKLFENWRKFVG